MFAQIIETLIDAIAIVTGQPHGRRFPRPGRLVGHQIAGGVAAVAGLGTQVVGEGRGALLCELLLLRTGRILRAGCGDAAAAAHVVAGG